MIKMIVVDLDGTLLKTDKTISEHTKNILNQCRESGIKIVYATGRGGSAERVAPAGLFDGRIIMNGAVASVGDSVVYNRLIPYETARPILIACDRYGLKTASETSGTHYSNFVTSDEWPNITNHIIVDFSQHDKDAEKLYILINNLDEVSFIERYLSDELYMSVSRDGMAMIMHRDATKSKAINELAKFWDIKQSEIIGFGDDVNDIDMLTYVGTGVAMGNAVDKVKAIADFVTLSNDEDGIVEWILSNKNLFFE